MTHQSHSVVSLGRKSLYQLIVMIEGSKINDREVKDQTKPEHSLTSRHKYSSTGSLKMVTLAATSYLEKLSHEKTDFETTLFPCISYVLDPH